MAHGDGARVNRAMTALEWAMLLALSVLWGGSFFFTGIAVKELPPLTIVVLRVALAAAMLCVTLRLLGLHLPRRAEPWAAFFGMGLLNNVVPFCLIVWGSDPYRLGPRRDPQCHDAARDRDRRARADR